MGMILPNEIEVEPIHSPKEYLVVLEERRKYYAGQYSLIEKVKENHDRSALMEHMASWMYDHLSFFISLLKKDSTDYKTAIEWLAELIEALKLDKDPVAADYWLTQLFRPRDKMAQAVPKHSQLFNNWVADWHAFYLAASKLHKDYWNLPNPSASC